MAQQAGRLTYAGFGFKAIDKKHTQGKAAMDGGFRKHGHGCPLLPPRPESKAFLHFISEICFLS
ncbi:hypothetical protein D3Z45_00235 [Lachnospiraceae bacterium]|nr:hypothetical protein [Lachnospiraceae bacterium]